MNRYVDEATYKHYPKLSEADRAECRAKADPIFWEKYSVGSMGAGRTMARSEAGDAYEACMDAKLK
jgi:hypothetical protein